MDACQDAGSSMSEPVLLSTLIPPVQAAAGFCSLCIGLIALYRACVDTPSGKCSSECNQNSHHATEQTRNSELQDL